MTHARVVVVIDKGQMVDMGTHQGLVESSVLYLSVCELQLDKVQSIERITA
ncbi:hypothetical protein [Pseudoalteromonas luteoviolacea]|uniref:hypothetical protein n=1 Tax=Pseudoalteromonas luteoviolacea TaxID=43657 RepID=UPI000AA55B68|nr:hypothetical protein [Pseudoalteromonas luteoviolacea]MBQ4876177.1 hypothetical protein [Pseudoalteromonas luteoviolacea]MBQ4906211.1 hypothetical protein [Pseudoalteromonas luteoviolacea]